MTKTNPAYDLGHRERHPFDDIEDEPVVTDGAGVGIPAPVEAPPTLEPRAVTAHEIKSILTPRL